MTKTPRILLERSGGPGGPGPEANWQTYAGLPDTYSDHPVCKGRITPLNPPYVSAGEGSHSQPSSRGVQVRLKGALWPDVVSKSFMEGTERTSVLAAAVVSKVSILCLGQLETDRLVFHL